MWNTFFAVGEPGRSHAFDVVSEDGLLEFWYAAEEALWMDLLEGGRAEWMGNACRRNCEQRWSKSDQAGEIAAEYLLLPAEDLDGGAVPGLVQFPQPFGEAPASHGSHRGSWPREQPR